MKQGSSIHIANLDALILLLLIVTLYPGWYWVTTFADPGCRESLPQRLIVSAPALVGLIGMVLSPVIARWGQVLLLFSATAVMYHIFYLTHLNPGSLIFVSGGYVAFFGMALGFREMRFAAVYCLLIVTAGIVQTFVTGSRDQVSIVATHITFSIILLTWIFLKEKLIRSRQEAESNMVYAAKMATLGEMAGNIAHEINTPLAVILTSAELLQRQKVADSTVAELSQTIVRTTHRISNVISGLRKFSRHESIEDLSANRIGQVLEETLSLCAVKLKSQNIKLEIVGDLDTLVFCNAVATAQIFLNILSNASDAMEQSKLPRKITIVIERLADLVSIAIVDTGPGVPRELHEKIMMPFFTTKEVGKGTGLGLPVSKGLAEKQGGTLVLDGEHAGGARFLLRLKAPSPSVN